MKAVLEGLNGNYYCPFCKSSNYDGENCNDCGFLNEISKDDDFEGGKLHPTIQKQLSLYAVNIEKALGQEKKESQSSCGNCGLPMKRVKKGKNIGKAYCRGCKS